MLEKYPRILRWIANMSASNNAIPLGSNPHFNAHGAMSINRPLLTHLNADTTWLLQLPQTQDRRVWNGRSHLNILIDPWLRGRQSDVAFWFSSQWHAIESSVQTIAQLNKMLEKAQDLEGSDAHTHCPDTKTNFIDAIIVSHEFTDHCHKRTLLEVDSTVPVFATAKAAALIRSWQHFKTVLEPTPFSSQQSDWQTTSASPLPGWLSISRIVTRSDALYYHSAIMVAFDLGIHRSDEIAKRNKAQAIIYTPHGIHAQDLRCLKLAEPPLETLALMHGLHDVKISAKQLNLGAHNGLQAQRICHAKHWVSTHDEVKKARGFIAPILFRKKLTFKDAIEDEKKRNGTGLLERNSELSVLEEVNFAELKNGESLVLG